MNPFYQSVFEDIQSLVRAGRIQQAQTLIEQELSVPYIPAEIEEQLRQMKQDLQIQVPPVLPDRMQNLDRLISGPLAAREKAVTLLCRANLRDWHDAVQKLLKDPELLDEFKGELVRELIRQRVDEDYVMDKDGLEIEFNPALRTPDSQDPVIVQTRRLFEDWLNTGFVLSEDFAGQLLEQEILETLPFDFSGTDPVSLAASIVRLVYLSMKDEAGWKKFEQEHHLENIQLYPLKIEKRGE